MRAGVLTCGLLLSLLLGSASPIHAEILYFTNGRTMAVKAVRTEANRIVVTLRGGGQATFDAAAVARIAPDEVPEPAAVSIPAEPVAAVAPPAAAPESFQSRPFAEIIDAVAARHQVDLSLVHAVVQTESNYQPRAKSRVGARGLMQVLPSTAAEFGVRNLYHPEANVEAGVQYLKSLLNRFELAEAVAAYNAGPGAVQKYGGIPPYRETQDYVRKVLANLPAQP